jgi:hypothetical protein
VAIPVVLVAGSRSYEHLEAVRNAVGSIESTALVISGGARGVDSIAIAHARALGLKTFVYPADWKTYGKRAGLLRNAVMVRMCTEALVFHDGTSRGTQHTLDLLDAGGKPYMLFGADGTLLLIAGLEGHEIAVTRQAPTVDLTEGEWVTGWVDL